MSFDINMNMQGLLPSQGGGGQFPPTSDETPYHRCVIKSGERKVNSKQNGEVVIFTLEGRSKEVAGMTHKATINIAHQDPEVAKRGAADMLAYVYAALGVQQIGNAGALFGKEIGVVVRLDPSNKEGENYTRIDHVVFADGRPLVVNGQLQPFAANPNGNFGGNNGGGFNQGGQTQQGGGFQTGGQTQQGGGQTQQFDSGAQVQQQGQFQPQTQQGGPQVGTMPNPNPNGGQQQGGQQQQGYSSPGQYQPQGDGQKPSWA